MSGETLNPVLYGLVLAGGSSTRMRRDKASLQYRGRTQLDRAFELAGRHVSDVFVSVRAPQTGEPTRSRYPLIVDALPGEGPIVGIRSALAAHPKAAWLILACDLPFLSDRSIEFLVGRRDAGGFATAYKSAHDGLPEPLCAIWEPSSADALGEYQAGGGHCPRKFLIRHGARLLDPQDARALDNVNTPEEYNQALATLDGSTPMQLKIHYYALMREQAGRSEETVETSAATPAALYNELLARYGFTLPRDQLRVAVNSEFSDWSRKLNVGDAVVFIPPVAGRVMHFRFAENAIDARSAREELQNFSAGGYVSFEGWVRDLNEGREVTRLEYEAFQELAVKEGDRIVAQALGRFPIRNALCIHRVGALDLGDMAVWVGVSAAHRGEAFDACRFIIDEVKHRVPIWKKEHYRSGDSGWVNCERCAAAAEHSHAGRHDADDVTDFK